ncbi:GspE/PulE family protein [Chryseomicrobium palamuruense]|uniref:GspE/PulE family protein n=1 Tax=Chryseomicrobium palamuruense TaxID=682973 RepID=A0ABV8V015_9BACL
MRVNSRKRLGDMLVDAGMITHEQLEYGLQNKLPTEKLGDYFIRENLITEQQLIEVLEMQLGIPHVNLTQYPIDPELTALVPKELAKRLLVLPIKRERNKLLLAMSDPMDYFAIEEVRMSTGLQIEPAIAAKYDLLRMLTKFYDLKETMDMSLQDIIPQDIDDENQIMDLDSPIVNLVNQLIGNAVTQRASDIHFDPQETDFRVRYRIDGVLHLERALPKYIQNVILARIKIMANLNITEHRIPQDGRIKQNINMKPVDIRVSTLPTIYGEKVVMRVLDLTNAINDISKLGFSDDNLKCFKKMLKRPNGIVLITGPTGSGKSSTLYAGLNRLNEDEVNIITVEDPVEYQLEGINQIQVKEEVGLTFAAGLRSILRQDPDIVMIGEIRDLETAQIAVRASLTGHLVLSTLHTNSAVESVSRLRDMGIEQFLIASSLVGVISQRLVRRVCRDCAVKEPVSTREKELFSENGIEIHEVVRGVGCPACNNTGYRGRLAVHEVLEVDDDIRSMVMEGKSQREIMRYMKTAGMKTLLQDGMEKVAQGITTTEEVFRVATLD